MPHHCRGIEKKKCYQFQSQDLKHPVPELTMSPDKGLSVFVEKANDDGGRGKVGHRVGLGQAGLELSLGHFFDNFGTILGVNM